MASTSAKIIGNLTNPLITDHDYYPIQVEIASLLANEWSVPVLLAAFASICGTVLLLAMVIVQKRNPNLRKIEKATIMWFVLCKLHQNAVFFAVAMCICAFLNRAATKVFTAHFEVR